MGVGEVRGEGGMGGGGYLVAVEGQVQALERVRQALHSISVNMCEWSTNVRPLMKVDRSKWITLNNRHLSTRLGAGE